MFHGAVGLGAEVSRRARGRKASSRCDAELCLRMADRLVFSKIRERLGGRIRLAASGAAPLGKDLARFYAAIGMPLIEGYGLTEGGVVCLNPLDRPKSGSIGVKLPGVEAAAGGRRRAAGQEPHAVLRILSGPGATEAVLRDGWLYTGDIAEIDRRRLRVHHRAQEGVDCFVQRQEDLSRAHRDAVQDASRSSIKWC